MRSTRSLIVLLAVFCLNPAAQPAHLLSHAQSGESTRKNYEFTNGQWYDGAKFVKRTFYSVNGILSEKKPRGATETIDLEGGFVVPPFAEAHNHNLGSPARP